MDAWGFEGGLTCAAGGRRRLVWGRSAFFLFIFMYPKRYYAEAAVGLTFGNMATFFDRMRYAGLSFLLYDAWF